MTYMVVIRRQAQKKLQSLSRTERNKIAGKIHQLGIDPDDAALDVKRLQGEPFFRLRVGDWRVIFERQDALRIISVERIKPRGDAYK